MWKLIDLNDSHEATVPHSNTVPLRLTFCNGLQILVYLTPHLCLCLLNLTIGVSIAGYERSFSKLKLIKSYLRCAMDESRLSALAILSTESEFIEKLDFGDIL